MQQTSINNIREAAKEQARNILAHSASFRHMPYDEQKQVYQDVMNEQMSLMMGNGSGSLSGQMKKKGDFVDKSSDLLNDQRHEKGFDEGVDSFEDLVDSVDFPEFVKDLLKAVFDANISVMKAQTDDYIRLMKEATTGLAKFIKQIDNTTTFAYLAENNGDEFGISMEEDGDGGQKMELTNPKGEKVDMEDNEVKAKIMDAKIKMAQEHRAALRETILMGVTRLVVEKGEVEAEVNFEFKGKRKVDKGDKAGVKTSKSSGTSAGYSGGLLGSIFGGPRAGHTSSTRQTQFSVSTTKSTSEDELKAKLRGFVKIQFKTDYFKLDNFAQMYGPASQEEKDAAAAKQ
ncbi:hypothetical protein JMN32_04480 [Fulvivirga sp. 29W222]|uniref:Uncharacterized protein n=1 Tax=Fulvivirga marina TaxID=2494733 RepID=A0A937FWC8_9BACT|nr:hypothetical protein [Fulvivirga marina]MBL6445551.1 hypothetical protein [Fulvivirga marina]